MPYMIVNTGRAASRAFYLNLRAQPDLIIPSRAQFDELISNYKQQDSTLHGFTRTIGLREKISGSFPPLGIVFHGVRPRLSFPFNNARNRSLLSDVRDKLGITIAFLVVRDPEKAFLSELNRRIATPFGDWKFQENILKWKKHYTLEDLEDLKHLDSLPSVNLPLQRNINIEALARDISVRTGKLFSLYQLFKAVFPKIYLIQYEQFLEKPRAVFEHIGRFSDNRFINYSLAETKLNGLANRLLIYNPIKLSLPKLKGDRLRNWKKKILRKNQSITGNQVRLRFEIEDVIELCEDWGVYKSVGIDCNNFIPNVAKDLKSKIGIGVNVNDLMSLPSSERNLFRNQDFLKELVGILAPVFRRNYDETKAFYKKLNFSCLPPEAQRISWEVNGREHEKMRELLENKEENLLK